MGVNLTTLTIFLFIQNLTDKYLLIHKDRYKNIVYCSTILKTGTKHVAVLKIQYNSNKKEVYTICKLTEYTDRIFLCLFLLILKRNKK